jgi:alpha-beta hydrolase superfamily lysophospholipase
VHGFSATRQEIAPVPERVAAALGANLFETRLAGHGRERDGLVDVRAEQWLDDGRELLGVGRALGERLTLIGTSTGATLALALASHPDFRVVDSLVLISPNFGPPHRGPAS